MSEQTPEQEKPRRMNAATVMDTMAPLLKTALARTPAEPTVSVELGATAKRVTQPTVKIHAPLGCDLEALAAHAEQVRLIAVAQYVAVGAQFPTEDGFVTADGPAKDGAE